MPKALPRSLILLFFAAGFGTRFRGGKRPHRDRWYGLEGKQDFKEFRRWWHREGKEAEGGEDLADYHDAQRAYCDWVSLGRPKAE
jgi:hypothetical protein